MIVYEMDTGEENERDEVPENNSSIFEENEVRNRIMMEGESHDPDSWINYVDYPGEDTSKVIIIYVMAIVQTIKETPVMNKMTDFWDLFFLQEISTICKTLYGGKSCF